MSTDDEFVNLRVHRDVIEDLVDPAWNTLISWHGIDVQLVTIPRRSLDGLRIAIQDVDPQYASRAPRARADDDRARGLHPSGDGEQPPPSRMGHLIVDNDLDDVPTVAEFYDPDVGLGF